MSVNPVPEGYNTVSVYMVVPKAKEALDFYGKAFGAETVSSMVGPDGESIMHAELKIGNSRVMLTEENPQWNMKSPATLGGSPVSMHVYVQDSDAAFNKAVEAGCEVAFPMENAFWGDRYGKVTDPYGFTWGFASRIEELSEEEVTRRGQEWMANMQEGQCGD